MKNIVTLFSMLGIGVVAGWQGHSLYAFFSDKPVVVSSPITEEPSQPMVLFFVGFFVFFCAP